MTHLDPKLSFVTQFDVYLLWKHCCDIYQNKVLFARWSHNLKRHANIDIVETRAKQWHQILLSPWECGICYCALLLFELVHFLNITEIIRKAVIRQKRIHPISILVLETKNLYNIYQYVYFSCWVWLIYSIPILWYFKSYAICNNDFDSMLLSAYYRNRTNKDPMKLVIWFLFLIEVSCKLVPLTNLACPEDIFSFESSVHYDEYGLKIT